MATQSWLECSACTIPPPWAPLFDQLKQIADGERCSCGEPLRLTLKFAFALGAGRNACTVVAAFRPRTTTGLTWQNAGEQVEFFPFLVLTTDPTETEAAWLPYWHVTTGTRKVLKYGQFAPYMDMHIFIDLLNQARQAGCLKALRTFNE